MSIFNPRKDYTLFELSEASADPNPFQQFSAWFGEARDANLIEANAMSLATATPEGVPSARIVLLKGYDERGFVFYTNYESQKGQELALNPSAALLFYWPSFERQVRITGQVSQVNRDESERYFLSRPLGARLGAAVSQQSQVIPSREWLANRFQDAEAALANGEVPLPDNWGGYRLAPESFEFWQGRPNRLHDRLRYLPEPGNRWTIERLSP